MKDRLIALGLIIVMTLNLFDVATDIQLQVPTWHIIEEAFIVFLSASMALYLIIDMHKRTLILKNLAESLEEKQSQLSILQNQFVVARKQYMNAISEQFGEWQLTSSEQEVALLLLKGFSHSEIATIRNTKEKTVRQQASNVYNKSDVGGRHELAAIFLDLDYSET